ncbi:hypothetical protein I549_2472 [Mycobacterium avium subsp. avium 2285 (R)]|nr:hypothetical protein I549_2472 [Mycobacterium avium subsp. avium 2285 (R)]
MMCVGAAGPAGPATMTSAAAAGAAAMAAAAAAATTSGFMSVNFDRMRLAYHLNTCPKHRE